MHEAICRNTAEDICVRRSKIYSFKELMQLVLQVTERNRMLIPVPTAIHTHFKHYSAITKTNVDTRSGIFDGSEYYCRMGSRGFEALSIETSEAILPMIGSQNAKNIVFRLVLGGITITQIFY